MRIRIRSGKINVEAGLNNSGTAKKIFDSLPIEGFANRWGNEIYFDIGLKIKEENSREDVEVGTIAYWPPGRAFCIFFGKTPASTTDKPKAASRVNILGKIVGNPTIFKKVKDGDKIIIEKNEE